VLADIDREGPLTLLATSDLGVEHRVATKAGQGDSRGAV
jgi:hypothetical protein